MSSQKRKFSAIIADSDDDASSDSGIINAGDVLSDNDSDRAPTPSDDLLLSSKRLKTPKKPRHHTFHSKADIHLLVGPEKIDYFVCSQNLACGSRVFDRMINGQWAEKKPNADNGNEEDWVIELPEDDALAFKLILDIIHIRFSNVPATLSDNDLFFVCVLTDKYELQNTIRPWAFGWATECYNFANDYKDWNSDRLYIAWVLGYQALFDDTIVFIARNAVPADDGSLTMDDVDFEPETHVYVESIPNLLDYIAEVRKEMLEMVLKPLHDAQTTLLDGGSCVVGGEDSDRCEALNYGFFMMGLQKEEWLPIPEAETTSFNVWDIENGISSLAGRQLEGHEGCTILPQLEAGVRAVRKARRRLFAFRANYREVLYERALKTGLEEERDVIDLDP